MNNTGGDFFSFPKNYTVNAHYSEVIIMKNFPFLNVKMLYPCNGSFILPGIDSVADLDSDSCSSH